jgi:hypothetical protein
MSLQPWKRAVAIAVAATMAGALLTTAVGGVESSSGASTTGTSDAHLKVVTVGGQSYETVTGGQTKTFEKSCPTGYLLTGGGHRFGDGTIDLDHEHPGSTSEAQVVSSRPDGNSWITTVTYRGPTNSLAPVYAYAQCSTLGG